MIKSKSKGREIVLLDGGWYYTGIWKPLEENVPCGHCGKKSTKEGYDGCIGFLGDNVNAACCGHGVEDEAYVWFYDGKELHGKGALEFFENSKF